MAFQAGLKVARSWQHTRSRLSTWWGVAARAAARHAARTSCSGGHRPGHHYHVTIPGLQPEGFMSKTQNVRLTWQRLQVSKQYAKRTCDSEKLSLSSILIDVLDRRIIPASDVDLLVSNLVAHIKGQGKEIARLSLLRQSCDDNDDDDEGALMIVDCH